MIIIVNSPPSGGVFYINPKDGIELLTLFSSSTYLWYDVDLPLQYAFGFLTSTGALMLSPISENPYTTSFYAAGLDSNGYNTSIVAQVYDSYLAFSTVTSNINVLPSYMTGHVLMQLGTVQFEFLSS